MKIARNLTEVLWYEALAKMAKTEQQLMMNVTWSDWERFGR